MAYETDLVALAQRVGINTMVGLINDSAVDLDAFRAENYYDAYMLQKIKIGQENYVFLKYAKSYSIPKGNENWLIRRTFPLTEHTTPLLEGIPPRSDKTRREKITGTYLQYARYMEFSDRVEWKLLDPIMMEYADEYGDVAIRTMNRLARKELLNSTMRVYCGASGAYVDSIGELKIGYSATLSQFRLAALKMARLLVSPIGGANYPIVTSDEHYWDLMTDPLIVAYIGSNNGLEHYKTGSLPDLFNLHFEKTMMDDYAYGYELGNPGEYLDGSTVKCRVYATLSDGSYWYTNLTAAAANRKTYVAAEYRQQSDFVSGKSRSVEEGLPDYISGTSGIENASESANRLSNGSWIPIRTIWTLTPATVLYGTDMAAALEADQATKTAWGRLFYTFDLTGGTVEKMFTLWMLKDDGVNYENLGYLTTSDSKLTAAAIATAVTAGTVAFPTLKQLPVHVAFMLGEEALAKIEVSGEGDVKMFAKQKGSSGVLDPVDQRQSIGFKINTLGFKRVREEACWLFFHVPTQAVATADISL